MERSLPATAVVAVNWLPVSWIPSPESPAKRMMTRSAVLTSGLELPCSVCDLISTLMIPGIGPTRGPGSRRDRQTSPSVAHGVEVDPVGVGNSDHPEYTPTGREGS